VSRVVSVLEIQAHAHAPLGIIRRELLDGGAKGQNAKVFLGTSDGVVTEQVGGISNGRPPIRFEAQPCIDIPIGIQAPAVPVGKPALALELSKDFCRQADVVSDQR